MIIDVRVRGWFHTLEICCVREKGVCTELDDQGHSWRKESFLYNLAMYALSVTIRSRS